MILAQRLVIHVERQQFASFAIFQFHWAIQRGLDFFGMQQVQHNGLPARWRSGSEQRIQIAAAPHVGNEYQHSARVRSNGWQDRIQRGTILPAHAAKVAQQIRATGATAERAKRLGAARVERPNLGVIVGRHPQIAQHRCQTQGIAAFMQLARAPIQRSRTIERDHDMDILLGFTQLQIKFIVTSVGRPINVAQIIAHAVAAVIAEGWRG